MTFICFIESEGTDVPHMQPLTSEDLTDAVAEARDLLSQKSRPLAAHVFLDEQRIKTITAAHLPGTARPPFATRRPSADRPA